MTSNQHTDGHNDECRQAVVAARDGCRDAFGEVYRVHAPRMVPLLWRLSGGDGARAEDWLQELFFRVWQKLDRLDDPARFEGWLKRLAINLVLSDRRRARLATESESLERQAAPAPPWPGADVDLEFAIAALPERARHVLILACIEGHSHGEIAELMGIDEGTSRGQLHRARQLLKETLS